MLQKTVILILNLIVLAKMESADKVNIPNFVQKVDATKKFQWSHNGGDVIQCSSFNWWRNLDGNWYVMVTLWIHQILQVPARTVPENSCQCWGNKTSKEYDEIKMVTVSTLTWPRRSLMLRSMKPKQVDEGEFESVFDVD